MSADPRAALTVLVTAFERHLEASTIRRGDDDPTVMAAYDDLADAFEEYDGALYDAYGEMTPLDIYTGDDEGDDDDALTDDEAPDDDEPDDDEDPVVGDADDVDADDIADDDIDADGIYAGLDDDIEYDDPASEPAGERR
ncbi:MAG: hypothetical protein ACRCYX_13385 [Dermatophilaceae bacterium]